MNDSDPRAVSLPLPPAEAQIRAAVPDDLRDVQVIYAHHVLQGTATFELVPPDLAEMTARYHTLVEAGYPFLVVQVADAIVGYAYAGPYRARPAYRFTAENSVYLRPEVRGRGYGRALLERLIEECSQRGFRQLVAVIGDSANTASVRLHEAAGFTLVGTLQNVGFKFNRWLDTVIMQRPLGAPPVGPVNEDR
jgi:L-amino acid N-acyltransferase YncA